MQDSISVKPFRGSLDILIDNLLFLIFFALRKYEEGVIANGDQFPENRYNRVP